MSIDNTIDLIEYLSNIFYFFFLIFSKSVANGITFYKNKQFTEFDDCDETIQFTVLINDLFDALNRKYPLEGIRKSSKDLEVSLWFCLL